MAASGRQGARLDSDVYQPLRENEMLFHFV
jgi:hypothetical protein